MTEQPIDPVAAVTPAQYKAALIGIRPKITKLMRAFLEAHFRAPDHRATPAELAAATHQANFSVTNMHYGPLGRLVGEYLGVKTLLLNEDGTPVWTSYLATGIKPPAGPDGKPVDFVWTMRPALVQALTELPWGMVPRKPSS